MWYHTHKRARRALYGDANKYKVSLFGGDLHHKTRLRVFALPDVPARLVVQGHHPHARPQHAHGAAVLREEVVLADGVFVVHREEQHRELGLRHREVERLVEVRLRLGPHALVRERARGARLRVRHGSGHRHLDVRVRRAHQLRVLEVVPPGAGDDGHGPRPPRRRRRAAQRRVQQILRLAHEPGVPVGDELPAVDPHRLVVRLEVQRDHLRAHGPRRGGVVVVGHEPVPRGVTPQQVLLRERRHDGLLRLLHAAEQFRLSPRTRKQLFAGHGFLEGLELGVLDGHERLQARRGVRLGLVGGVGGIRLVVAFLVVVVVRDLLLRRGGLARRARALLLVLLVLQLVANDHAAAQGGRGRPGRHVPARRDGELFAELLLQDVRHLGALRDAAVVLQRDDDGVLRDRVRVRPDRGDRGPERDGLRARAAVLDDGAVLPAVVAVELDDAAPVQQRALDGVGGRVGQELVPGEVGVVRAVDEVVRHGLVHRGLVNHGLPHHEVVSGEHERVERRGHVVFILQLVGREFVLRVAEKAFQRLLRDDACLFVEVPFEHLPGDVKLRVEHARHGLEEIVRLSLAHAVEVEGSSTRGGGEAGPHLSWNSPNVPSAVRRGDRLRLTVP
mmetsp:Transcript_15900/g.67026  ORF Transcript_15900/g.67026 Transcript_15900/m.67026 type:complete len:617 (+) Transcript_15900:1338-3188(+)